ncbi:hypothetical protein TNCV_3412701 [Trichonephila clavipes]|uniref:Uncharacterized protein n=1 Tax=Trichonephila clavipes TaxID=2585209 RepID=A0A8X6RJT4_TRICX|nr:hypothetical protein TNCV_3412701 [Trichonephila clavipes]
MRLDKVLTCIHGCRTSDVGDQGLSRDFSQQELLLAMAFLDMTKSPGPDGVFGRMLENLVTGENLDF